MANSSNDNDESEFFDAEEQISQEPDIVCDFLPFKEYNVWIGAPQSVKERRTEFVRRTGLGLVESRLENRVDIRDNSTSDRIMENSGAVLRMSEDEFSSSDSSLSSRNLDDFDSREFRNENSNSNGESECIVDGILGEGQFGNSPLSSPSVNVCSSRKTKDSKKNMWLSKLRSMTCVMPSENVRDDDDVCPSGFDRVRRVRVRNSRKRSKEISALFTGLDIKAHEGAIIAMKFSPDGKYLASAGEDKSVKIWQVVEDERLKTNIDVRYLDPSCVYFSANRSSESGSFTVEKGNFFSKSKSSSRKTQDSACVIFPPKIFRILEKPLHVFEGHDGEILDISWSKNNCLLSSSADKTVRLWRVGVDHCIKIFPHSDYVTTIQFNPVNDDNFISGSIDGKVRIWSISDRKVIDWTETTDIITAVSYCPDGQRGIIGSITGTCRHFDLSDNHIQLGSQICLTKKKSACKRITAFQFLPQDPGKILVTCADSKIRIIERVDVIGKYKGGLGNAGNQISATVTSNGKHIVSASDDSNIYIWNYTDQSKPSVSKPKPIRSFECFPSEANIAVPWPGPKDEGSTNSRPLSPSDCFSLMSQEYFLDSIPKGSAATWPEEKLPIPSPPTPIKPKSPLSKSQFKLLKSSCRSSNESHTWGLVIVTAGLDGRIRSFHNYGLPVSL